MRETFETYKCQNCYYIIRSLVIKFFNENTYVSEDNIKCSDFYNAFIEWCNSEKIYIPSGGGKKHIYSIIRNDLPYRTIGIVNGVTVRNVLYGITVKGAEQFR